MYRSRPGWGQRRAISQAMVQKKAMPYGLAIAGATAFKTGLSPVNCPYVLDSPEWRAWFGGWMWEMDMVGYWLL